MAYEVRVTRQGQTTIPKHLRERYMIQEGDKIMFVDLGDHLAILPVPKNPVKVLRDLNIDVMESPQDMRREALETAQRLVKRKLER